MTSNITQKSGWYSNFFFFGGSTLRITFASIWESNLLLLKFSIEANTYNSQSIQKNQCKICIDHLYLPTEASNSRVRIHTCRPLQLFHTMNCISFRAIMQWRHCGSYRAVSKLREIFSIEQTEKTNRRHLKGRMSGVCKQ